MDGRRFDAIARELTERATRRRVMGRLLGLAAGASALAGTADAGASARTCRVVGQKCVQGRQCCSGYCQASGRRSRVRICACPEGTVPCNGGCVALGSDDHCLSCNDACSSGTVCCDSGCTELGTQANCSTCGDACDGASDELCFGADGCQHACYGHTAEGSGGYFTTDNPPVFYEAAMDQRVAYTRHVQNNPAATGATPCQTSADCTGCATVLPTGNWVKTGCGCLQVACGTDGNGGPDWEDLENYFCAATVKSR